MPPHYQNLQQNLKHQSCLAIWSTAMTQLQLNSINATRTNSNRRGKAQHRHSARVPSESAVGCISLSPILPCSEALLTKDRAPSILQRTARTLSVSLLTAKPRQDWSRTLGDIPTRSPLSLSSPAVREAMSVRSKAAKGTEETTDGPREDAARPRTTAEPGETTVGVGEQLPHFPTLLRT